MRIMRDDIKVILASASPRRREILAKLGISFEICVSGADEAVEGAASPEDYVVRASQIKCGAVAERLGAEGRLDDDTLMIACDTVVVYNGFVIGKPPDTSHAILTLGMLSDSWHAVWSGLTLRYRGTTVSSAARTDVKFRALSEEEIRLYVESGEPMGKAGSYAIQEKGMSFVERIDGDYYNVVGLPVSEFFRMLRENFSIDPVDIMHYDRPTDEIN